MVTCDYIYIDKVSHLKSLASYFGLLDSQRNRLWALASRLHPPLLQKLFRPILAFCLASFVLVTVQVQRLLRPLVHIQFNTFQLTGTFIGAEFESHQSPSSPFATPRHYTHLHAQMRARYHFYVDLTAGSFAPHSSTFNLTSL